MTVLRSLLYAALFYGGTALWVLAGVLVSPFGRRPTLAVVLSWADLNHWLARHVLGIRTRVEGVIPDGPYLIAVKHEASLETTEMVRLTKQYGVIPVERTAGAKALRAMVAAGKEAVESGRAVMIFPEGTRVPYGQAPPLRPGFAGLYRALGLPVVPVAVDTGRLWGRGLVHRPGVATYKVGEVIPAGLKREEVEARVHAAINALAPQARA